MILVTGGTGLVGSHLLKKLVANNQLVKAIYRNQNTIPTELKDNKNINWIQADLLDIPALEDAFESVTHVYHAAATVSFIKKNRDIMYAVNVTGTANIVNLCLHFKVAKLIHVSSVAALGRIRPGEHINETMYWTEDSSNSIYGHTKYLGEMHVWRGIEEGLCAAIINPSIILGCSNWNDGSSSIFRNVYNQFKWYTTGSSGFVAVQDVVLAMQQLMQSSIENERFIISGINCTYQHTLNTIAKGFNKKPPHKQVTPLIAAIVWRLEKVKSFFTGKEPLITKETAATALTNVAYDNSKSLQQIPDFIYSDFEEAVGGICEEFKLKYSLIN
jgi:dihydroflavonol-4-reductase